MQFNFPIRIWVKPFETVRKKNPLFQSKVWCQAVVSALLYYHRQWAVAKGKAHGVEAGPLAFI